MREEGVWELGGRDTHEVECVLFLQTITDSSFLELEEFVQVGIEIGVAFVDLAGSFEGEFLYWCVVSRRSLLVPLMQ